MQVASIPTGSLSLDMALGVGGIPKARITEIFGPESSGKTTLCQHIVAECQAQGGTAAFIDMEHALDPTYAARCGVKIDELLISQPDTGEQALEIAETLVRSAVIGARITGWSIFTGPIEIGFSFGTVFGCPKIRHGA